MDQYANRLGRLLELLKRDKVDIFMLPNTDEFGSEYVKNSRVEWLTGFTGSAATVAVSRKRSAFFADGRYTLQAEKQVNKKLYDILQINDLANWLRKNTKNQQVAFDASLYTKAQIDHYGKLIKNIRLLDTNPMDELWKTRTAKSSVYSYDIEFAGENSESKRKRIAKCFASDALLITSPDSICWLLNIRGSDLDHTPLVFCYAILYQDGTVDLFLHEGSELNNGITNIRCYNFAAIDEVFKQIKEKGQSITLDPSSNPIKIHDKLANIGIKIIYEDDPCQVKKAIKNNIEIANAKKINIYDGVAFIKFWYWLERQLACAGQLSEIGVAEKLLEFRQMQPLFRGPSFSTIAAFAENGAIIHYSPTEASNKKIEGNGLLLIDSGGQYLGGTTDMTRTILIGTPTQQQKIHYTLVLKGHIALAMAKFPKGTSGAQLDILARYFLWQSYLNYSHSTGHGVGNYLSVHEKPPTISPRGTKIPLEAGMILSNEPGFYLSGQYGIRIESLLCVKKANKGFLSFQTLACAPIDMRLMENSLLSQHEKKWLKNYHGFVYKSASPYISQAEQRWLSQFIPL